MERKRPKRPKCPRKTLGGETLTRRQNSSDRPIRLRTPTATKRRVRREAMHRREGSKSIRQPTIATVRSNRPSQHSTGTNTETMVSMAPTQAATPTARQDACNTPNLIPAASVRTLPSPKPSSPRFARHLIVSQTACGPNTAKRKAFDRRQLRRRHATRSARESRTKRGGPKRPEIRTTPPTALPVGPVLAIYGLTTSAFWKIHPIPLQFLFTRGVGPNKGPAMGPGTTMPDY